MCAHMVPPTPKDFDPRSKEGVVFNALKKLPEDYYVLHSTNVIYVDSRKKLVDREIDFVVINKKLGALCIEAKKGDGITYHDRNWYYTGGDKMKHNGPYNQVATVKRDLRDKIKNHESEDIREISKRFKMLHAVWFFGMPKESFLEKNQALPEDALIDLTMFSDDLEDPKTAIEKIFSIKVPVPFDDEKVFQTNLTDDEFRFLIEQVFCPHFNLIPSPKAKNDIIAEGMNQLLREQYVLLDFLEEQDSAVINGVAGTGKTMIATEKARRHSEKGESVLFLCYNTLLNKKLIRDNKESKNNSHNKMYKYVDFMTLSKLTKEKTGNFQDYIGLMNWLKECEYHPEKFGYKHVIIDEGQDFGLVNNVDRSETEAKQNCSIINSLQTVVKNAGGTFYLFYDKYQMIQGGESVRYELPDCIADSDCKLTLHCNCRNTEQIAKTSVTPLRDEKNRAIKAQTACSWYEPVTPVMHIVGSENKAIKSIHAILDKYAEQHIEDVVILTPGSLNYCCLADKFITDSSEEYEGYKIYPYRGVNYRVTTCIKFKGLEADAIIVIDLKKDSFKGYKGMEFYVGSSRAKQYLDFVAEIVPNEYKEILDFFAPGAKIKNEPDRLRIAIGRVFSADVTTD